MTNDRCQVGDDRYGRDVLSSDPHSPRRRRSTPLPAQTGVVVEDVETGWCGAVVAMERSGGVHVVVLEDRRGRTRSFPLGAGFHHEGRPVELVAPTAPAAQPERRRTASGSFHTGPVRARTARASRILVEGRHDAELVERVWGDDLRVAGVVVEPLHGVDDLASVVHDFAPGPGRRLGVLVDHLVAGSKEWRIAERALAQPGVTAHVRVVGHPYVDVWQAVRPERVGLASWPRIPRSTPWKEGVLDHLGWPSRTQADVADGWRRILASVRSYADLEPALLARVEELIDFTTGDTADA